ncbi:Ig-like domain-containing protein [Ramlibacter sp. PS4R-6]|uniref:Ig-like domain-containing protein n=1 Tax=Ramlibacter sp. PS4R-6 TaxID=3133438 RepID=UPI0030A6D617
MNRLKSIRPWLTALLVGALVACGGGGRDKVLGFDGPAAPPPVPPTVTAVAPVNNATGVPTNNTIITAAFSEPMAPITGTASFTVTCAAPCVNPAGTVTLDSTGRIATFALPAGAALAAGTTYTATVTGAKSAASGLALAVPYVWQFTTGVVADTTRPSVVLTVPATTSPGPTAGVATNTAISALFSEDMAAASLSASTFTLTCAAPCTSPAGTVSYSVGNRTAVFTPAAALAASTTYVATITTGATDLAGNALAGNQAALPAASNHVWSFTTAAGPIAATNVSVASTNPVAGATTVCTNATVNATFAVPSGLRMDPNSINSAVFTVSGAAPVVASSVVLDAATGRIATFTPAAPLVAGTQYTARIKGGATGAVDLAVPANTLLADATWNFTAVNCAAPPPPSVALGSSSLFGAFGGSAGVTNQGLNTVINGNLGTTAVSTAVTGFHDAGPGCTYIETGLNVGTVNGLIYTAPPPPTIACPNEGTATTFAIATQARADALAAYNALVAMPGGPDPGAGNLANKTLAPGVYTAAAGSFMIQGGNLTLDAQGDANAVWVFQMATTLTVGGPGAAAPASIIMANGAQAKNVYWQVGSAATINAAGGGTFYGTVISQAGAAISTPGNVALVTINGRVLSLGASVTMVNTVINVPAP